MKEKFKTIVTPYTPYIPVIGVVLFWVAAACIIALAMIDFALLQVVAIVAATITFIYCVSSLVYGELKDKWGD